MTAPRDPTTELVADLTADPPAFEALGGMAFFERLVDSFYAGVADDPVLRPLYPDADLEPARRRLTLFLAQYWGGPTTYSAERGHPRLRSRHFRFGIGSQERDRWLAHMRAAVEASGASELWRAALLGYFETAADAMRNLDR